MKLCHLTSRFLIPVGAALALVTGAAIVDVSRAQTRAAEAAFQEQLTTLAVSSRFMLHAWADAYCRSRGMAFHRVLADRDPGTGPEADFQRDALRAFRQDPGLASLSRTYPGPDGVPRMSVLAPATLQDECVSCHAARGMDRLRGRRIGELVGAFGVSASTAPLHRSIERTRLLVGLAGLGVLAGICLIVTYLLHRTILRPLSALYESMSRMARGDLTVRVPVTSGDEIGHLAVHFNEMGARLHEADQAYMEMLAFVSHELRNPIASMITDAQVLTGGYLGPLEPRQRQKLVRFIGSGGHLLGLIRNYLDLARMEGGQLAFQPRACAFPEEVLEPALDLVMPQLEARRMILERRVPQGLEAQCDPELMEIVLVNLLGNAVKYGRDDGLLRVTAEKLPDRLRVAVWNQGPGFPAQERPRLFRRFSRLRSPGLQDRKGTGVGLYTAWRMVALHGGSMDAVSEPGEWAEFSLEIPQPLPENPEARAPADL